MLPDEEHVLEKLCVDLENTNIAENNNNNNINMDVDEINKFAAFVRESKSANEKKKMTVYWKRYNSFIKSPKVHFFYDTLFYIIFLMMFSYMLLCDFNYYTITKEIIFTDEIRSFGNSTHAFSMNSTVITQKKVHAPNVIEYILVFWIVSFIFEEFNQVNGLIYFLICGIFSWKNLDNSYIYQKVIFFEK